MNVEFSRRFSKDLRAIELGHISAKVQDLIELISAAQNLTDIPNLKKINGPKGHYRLRVGNFRIGIKLEGDTLILIRILDRKEIYKYFP